MPSGANISFYRTAAGTEPDAVVAMGPRKIGFKAKLSSAPAVTKGFWQACEDLQLDACAISPVKGGWPMKPPAKVISVMDTDRLLDKIAS